MKKEIASTQVEKECSLRKLYEEELSEVSGGGFFSNLFLGATLLANSVFGGWTTEIGKNHKNDGTYGVTLSEPDNAGFIDVKDVQSSVHLGRFFPGAWRGRQSVGLSSLSFGKNFMNSVVTVDPRNSHYRAFDDVVVALDCVDGVAHLVGKCPQRWTIPKDFPVLHGEDMARCVDQTTEIEVEAGNYGKVPGTKTGVFVARQLSNEFAARGIYINKDEAKNAVIRITEDMPKSMPVDHLVGKVKKFIIETNNGDMVCGEDLYIPGDLDKDASGVKGCIENAKTVTIDKAQQNFVKLTPNVVALTDGKSGAVEVCPIDDEGGLRIPANAPEGLGNCIKKSDKTIIDPVKFGQTFGQAGGLVWRYNEFEEAEVLQVDPDEVKLTKDTPYIKDLDELLKKTKKITVEPDCPHYIDYKGQVAPRSIEPSLKVLDSIPKDKESLRKFVEIKVDQHKDIKNPSLAGLHEDPASVAERFCKENPFSYDENRQEPQNISKRTLLDAKAAVLSALELANPEVYSGSQVCNNGKCIVDDLAKEPDEITDTAKKERFIIDDKLDMFKEKVSDYDRAKAVYSWVTENIAYNLAEGSDENLEGPEQCESQFLNHASQVLDRKMGVCRGYAHLTNLLMRVAGIPSAYLTGNGHAINAIFINGDWHLIDSTHDSHQIVNRHLYKVKRKNLPKNYKEDPRYNNKDVPHRKEIPTEDHFPSKDKSAAKHNIDFITYGYGTNDWSGDLAWERYESPHNLKTVSVEGEPKTVKEKILNFFGF